MKCIKCETTNINKANYCKSCGYHFSKEEQEAAKSKTFVGKLEKLEDWYKKCTLKFITGHIAFKIVSLLIVLIIGLSFFFRFGSSFKILESDEYTIKYNANLNEYYLLTNNDQISLNLYKPNRLKALQIIHQDLVNNETTTIEYHDGIDIILNVNGEYDEYILNGTYDKTNESIKLYVYRVGDIYE